MSELEEARFAQGRLQMELDFAARVIARLVVQLEETDARIDSLLAKTQGEEKADG